MSRHVADSDPPEMEVPEGNLGSDVGRLAGLLASPHYPSGDRAALKRHAPGQPVPLAFYRLWLRHLGTDLPGPAQTGAWALLAWGLALSGAGAHRPDRSFGRALAEARCSEMRLERLLAAGDDLSRERLLAALVRLLATKGEAFDWTQVARLLLTRDVERREAVHRRIATDFYRHQTRLEKE